MTHPLELLTKAATAKVGSVYETIQIGSGGGPHQTVSFRLGSLLDIMGFAMGGLNATSFALLLLKYGDGGVSERNILFLDTIVHLMHSGHRQSKKRQAQMTMDNIHAVSVAVVKEWTGSRACSSCRGTGIAWEGQKQQDCPHCITGRRAWTYEERAKAMGVSRSTYYRLRWMYAIAMAYLRGLETEAKDIMRERLQ